MLREVLPTRTSIAAVSRAMGLSDSGGHHRFIKCRIKLLGLDVTHFNGKREIVSGTKGFQRALSDILVYGHQEDGRHLKKRLILEGLLKEECSKCGQGSVWNGEPLSLQLDHIDGDILNNRLENLRILCPNCHCQTPTWGSKKREKST
jgi:ribosomal protein S27AE